MELTRKQEEGLKIAVSRYYNHEPYTVIAGFAGTGKTTLVKFIISALNIPQELVCYTSYTGKATLVLREHGCLNAITAHKLLYKSYMNKDGTFINIPKPVLEHRYSIIVVDEISMLPKKMWDLLLNHGIYILALGDPGQLPPIGEDNHVLDKPHIFLDEVMRQAKESEIIQLTMDIRNEKPLKYHMGKEVRIISKSEVCSGLYKWADQIIAGKNITKNIINMQMRDILNFKSKDLEDGDKIICLRNNWDILSSYEEPLVNGLIGIAKNPKIKDDFFVGKKIVLDFYPDSFYKNQNELYKDIAIDEKLLRTGEASINSSNFKKFPKSVSKGIQQFDYAYCITCHKSQGSQYNKVLVFEERLKSTEHKKWLYTAATRAKEKLIIVKE